MASRRIEDLHPAFQPLVRKFLSACKAAGHDVIVTCGYRSAKEQDELYTQGRTTPGKRITNARGGQSWHNYGLAVDVVFIRGGEAWWDGPWEQIGRIGESFGLVWGGRFKTLPDRPHFEWHPGLTLARAKELVAKGYKPTQIPVPIEGRHQDV